MNRSYVRTSSLARKYFEDFPDEQQMPLALLPAEQQAAFSDLVLPLLHLSSDDASSSPLTTDSCTAAVLRLIEVFSSPGGGFKTYHAARAAADYVQSPLVRWYLSGWQESGPSRHTRTARAGSPCLLLMTPPHPHDPQSQLGACPPPHRTCPQHSSNTAHFSTPVTTTHTTGPMHPRHGRSLLPAARHNCLGSSRPSHLLRAAHRRPKAPVGCQPPRRRRGGLDKSCQPPTA